MRIGDRVKDIVCEGDINRGIGTVIDVHSIPGPPSGIFAANVQWDNPIPEKSPFFGEESYNVTEDYVEDLEVIIE